MHTFHLEILSPERAFYVGECVSLVIPISDGMLGIMAHHLPLTAVICNGEVTLTLPDGSRQICAITQGMVNVSGNEVKVLCESALHPEEIDTEKERRVAEEAKLEMKKQQGKKDYVLSQIAFAKAMNHLRVKQHSENL